MTDLPPRLLVTMGDAAGIGPEIVARAFDTGDAARCVVIGDLGVMRRALALLPQAYCCSAAVPGRELLWLTCAGAAMLQSVLW